MTLREIQVILLLYRACTDEGARRRALALLPELGEFVSDDDKIIRTVHRVVRTDRAPWRAMEAVDVICACGTKIEGYNIDEALKLFAEHGISRG